LQHVSSAAAAPEAEKALLLSLPNPKDGLVDAYLNRKLSRPLTQLFLRTSLTPNQITVLSCLIGLIGAACFWGGGYAWPILGGLLLQFSAVVDCIDGEVARVKFLESPFGAWLDITLDTVVHIAIFLGVGIAVWKQGGGTSAPLFGGALAVGAALSFPFVTMAEKTEEQGKQQGGWENTIIQNMIEGLTSRDYSIIVLLCALIQRLSWFLWSAAIGVQVFWVTLAVLLHKTGRLNWAVFSSRSQDA
jgi:phosphatidylglycerophosphate synthase